MRIAVCLLLFTLPFTAFSQKLEKIAPAEYILEGNQPTINIQSIQHFLPPFNILYIVDGIPLDINDQSCIAEINPDHIERITAINRTNTAQLFCKPWDGIALITLKKDISLHYMKIAAAGFDIFLASQPPKEHYCEEVLRSKNILLVSEWNKQCKNSIQLDFSHNTLINYDPEQSYGLEIEHQLYMFFKFMGKNIQPI